MAQNVCTAAVPMETYCAIMLSISFFLMQITHGYPMRIAIEVPKHNFAFYISGAARRGSKRPWNGSWPIRTYSYTLYGTLRL